MQTADETSGHATTEKEKEQQKKEKPNQNCCDVPLHLPNKSLFWKKTKNKKNRHSPKTSDRMRCASGDKRKYLVAAKMSAKIEKRGSVQSAVEEY